jgi:hypothetical protein
MTENPKIFSRYINSIARVCAFASLIFLLSQVVHGIQARAGEVDAMIVFAVDVSSSIDPATANLQREGHAAALHSPEILAAIARNRIGCIAITYFEWSSPGHLRSIVPWRTICGSRDAKVVAAAITTKGSTGFGRSSGRGTSVSYATDMGSLFLDEYQGTAPRKIIDISANGSNNDGLPVEQSRAKAISKGYTINAIAIPSKIPGDERDIADYFAMNVIGGLGSFVISPMGKADYASALSRKLVVEIGMAAFSRR